MLTIVRNLTWAFDATIFDTFVADGDPGNVPTNHTGWTIRSQIRTRVGNKLVANLNVTFPVPTAGTVAIRHEREFTRSLAIGDYWWSIVATDPAGYDHVYVEPELIAVRDHPTDPANATYDFVPGGGGAVMHTHVISDVTGLQAALNNKAPLTHTHSVSDVTGLQTILDGKAPLAHTHTIADVLGLQTILNDLSEGGGGSTTYAGLTDAATVDLPVINGPLASALAGKETAGAAATAQAFAIQRANHTGTQAQSTIVNLVSDLAGKASLAGNNTFTAQQAFTDATTWSYTSAAASAHRIALGAGTTGAELFGAATAAAARTTLELGAFSTDGSITGTGALTLAAGGSNQPVNISGSGTGVVALGQATVTSSIFPPLDMRRTTVATNSTVASSRLTAISSGDVASGFGPFFSFNFSDTGITNQNMGAIGFVRTSADNVSDFVVLNQNGASQVERFRVKANGDATVQGTTASTTTTTGALVVSGGAGIAGAVNSLYQRVGSGTPEGVVTAPVGAVFHRTDGGAGTSFYVKESGAGNTGWVAK